MYDTTHRASHSSGAQHSYSATHHFQHGSTTAVAAQGSAVEGCSMQRTWLDGCSTQGLGWVERDATSTHVAAGLLHDGCMLGSHVLVRVAACWLHAGVTWSGLLHDGCMLGSHVSVRVAACWLHAGVTRIGLGCCMMATCWYHTYWSGVLHDG